MDELIRVLGTMVLLAIPFVIVAGIFYVFCKIQELSDDVEYLKGKYKK